MISLALDQDVQDRIEATIISVLALGDTDNLDPAQRFADDLDADSLDLVELVMALEEEFNIVVPEEDVATVVSVGDLYEYVERVLNDNND